jgi:hypothetical protein
MSTTVMNKPITIRTGVGMVWFAGFLFTLGFLHLTGWKIFFALFGWPYYLGVAAH